jgi:hypothetical protein
MDEIEILKLSDKNVVPTDEFVYSVIGERKEYWQTIIRYATENYREVSGSWNYYNDGKQWVYKFVEKKKTLFWAVLLKDTFRLTFYFGDKAEPMIAASGVPVEIVESFKTSKRYGAIRGITFNVYSKSDLENIIRLMDVKHKLK